MIGFIDVFFVQSFLITISTAISLIYHTLQFTIAHALGFSVSTSCILATDLKTRTITSNHYEVILSFLVQSLCNADLPELEQILFPVSWFLTMHSSVLCTNQCYSYKQIPVIQTRRGPHTKYFCCYVARTT
jgi:hypothetical protein